MFRSRFPYGKSCPNYRAVSPRSAPPDRGNKMRGGPIRIWLLGNGPEKKKKKTTLPSLLLPAPLLSSPLLSSCSLPLGSGSAEAKPPPPVRRIRMFLGDRQISGLAPVQRTGHANSHTESRQC